MPTKPKNGEKLTPLPKAPKKPATRPEQTGRPSAGEAPSAAPDLSKISVALEAKAVRTGDIAFLVENPMEHSDDSMEEMREELRARGQILPLVINRRPTPPVVVGGNKRLAVMLQEGWEWAAVVEVDCSPEDEAALAITLNATQDRSWNKEKLQAALHRMKGLNLGERRDALLAKLAEKQKLTSRRESDEQAQPPAPPVFRIVVTCRDEQHQGELFERLRGEGLECKSVKAGG